MPHLIDVRRLFVGLFVTCFLVTFVSSGELLAVFDPTPGGECDNKCRERQDFVQVDANGNPTTYIFATYVTCHLCVAGKCLPHGMDGDVEFTECRNMEDNQVYTFYPQGTPKCDLTGITFAEAEVTTSGEPTGTLSIYKVKRCVLLD